MSRDYISFAITDILRYAKKRTDLYRNLIEAYCILLFDIVTIQLFPVQKLRYLVDSFNYYILDIKQRLRIFVLKRNL
jgi:hypothetical protein